MVYLSGRADKAHWQKHYPTWLARNSMAEESTKCIRWRWTRLFEGPEPILPMTFVFKDAVKVDLEKIQYRPRLKMHCLSLVYFFFFPLLTLWAHTQCFNHLHIRQNTLNKGKWVKLLSLPIFPILKDESKKRGHIKDYLGQAWIFCGTVAVNAADLKI